MNRSAKKVWVRTSSRKFIGLLFTVIWLATALQPCVMASVSGLHPQSVEAHHSRGTSSGHSAGSHSPCPHCKTTTSTDDHCTPEPDDCCNGNGTFIYFERLKPVDTDKFDAQFESVAFFSSLHPITRAYSKPVARLSKALNLRAGPSLIDLYRVYLK